MRNPQAQQSTAPRQVLDEDPDRAFDAARSEVTPFRPLRPFWYPSCMPATSVDDSEAPSMRKPKAALVGLALYLCGTVFATEAPSRLHPGETPHPMLSPDGQRLVLAMPVEGQASLGVRVWDDPPLTEIVRTSEASSIQASWLDATLLLLQRFSDDAPQRTLTGVFVIEANGTSIDLSASDRTAVNLLRAGETRFEVISPLRAGTFVARITGAAGTEVAMIEPGTGGRERLLPEIDGLTDFLERDGQPVLVLQTVDDRQRLSAAIGDEWITLLDRPAGTLRLEGWHGPSSALLGRRDDTETWVLDLVDLEGPTVSGPILSEAGVDLGRVRFAAWRENPLSVTVLTSPSRSISLDPAHRRVQQGVDLALPGRSNTIVSSANRRHVVRSQSLATGLEPDIDEPVRFYLLDERRATLRGLPGTSP